MDLIHDGSLHLRIFEDRVIGHGRPYTEDNKVWDQILSLEGGGVDASPVFFEHASRLV